MELKQFSDSQKCAERIWYNSSLVTAALKPQNITVQSSMRDALEAFAANKTFGVLRNVVQDLRQRTVSALQELISGMERVS